MYYEYKGAGLRMLGYQVYQVFQVTRILDITGY